MAGVPAIAEEAAALVTSSKVVRLPENFCAKSPISDLQQLVTFNGRRGSRCGSCRSDHRVRSVFSRWVIFGTDKAEDCVTSKPKPTRTMGALHFEDLEPHRFEDLIRQLAYDFRSWRQLEATGRAGGDDGFDVRGFETNPHAEVLERVPVMLSHFSGVMAGLVPAIHALLADTRHEKRGCPRQARA
jgi:hypothetical protein